MLRRVPIWVLLLLPVIILGLVAMGVAVHESGQADVVFAPAHPEAHDLLRFSYDLADQAGHTVRDADVTLRLVKVSALPSLLSANYLRADNGFTGEIFRTQLHSFDGRIEFQSIVWDAGRYAVQLQATAPGLAAPITQEFAVDVAMPLGVKLSTLLLYVALLVAGVGTGLLASTLTPPARKRAVRTLLLLLVGLTLAAAPSARAQMTADPGLQVQMKPEVPVQKGAPVDFTVRLDAERPLKQVDAFVTLYHIDDRIPMLTLRTGTTDGTLHFAYAFPDTASYRLSVHGASADPTAFFAPLTRDYTFLVQPVQPDGKTQLLAMSTLLLTAAAGFAFGFRKGRSGAAS